MKPSFLQSLTRFLPGYALLAALLLMHGIGNASSFLTNHFRHYWPPTAAVAGQGSVVAATVTRVGSDFQISWMIEGAVDQVKIQEGPSPLVGSGRLGKAIYVAPQLFDRAEYLRAALDEMRRIYGTFEIYVHQALGITDDQLEQIRENLLKG